MLSPVAALDRPRQVAGWLHAVEPAVVEVAEGQALGIAQQVAELDQHFVGVIRAGHLALKNIVRRIGQGDRGIDDLQRRRSKDVEGILFPGKGLPGNGIDDRLW